MLSSPMTTSSSKTAFMPIRQSLPTLAPWIMAPCPMCAPEAKCTVSPGNMCNTHDSWTLHPSSNTISPQSPRKTAPDPT